MFIENNEVSWGGEIYQCVCNIFEAYFGELQSLYLKKSINEKTRHHVPLETKQGK